VYASCVCRLSRYMHLGKQTHTQTTKHTQSYMSSIDMHEKSREEYMEHTKLEYTKFVVLSPFETVLYLVVVVLLLMVQRIMNLLVGLRIIAGSHAANSSLQRLAALNRAHKICPEHHVIFSTYVVVLHMCGTTCICLCRCKSLEIFV
jgi:hypothetical protein